MTDIKMIFITIKNVLMRKDINSATAATMGVFMEIINFLL